MSALEQEPQALPAPIDIDDEELLTVEELAAWLKVKTSWIYERSRERKKGSKKKGLDLPHIKLGHYLRFEKQAVLEFLKRQRKSYLSTGRSQ